MHQSPIFFRAESTENFSSVLQMVLLLGTVKLVAVLKKEGLLLSEISDWLSATGGGQGAEGVPILTTFSP